MMQIITGCTGDNCLKHKDCELYYENLSKKLNTSFPLESWATFGSTTTWANSEGEYGWKTDYSCGPNGDYKMFKQYTKPLNLITLGEMKSMCLEHQKQNRDCETCKIFKFCNHEMTTSHPSGWKSVKEGNDNDL